jgi:hypothetical protein
MADCRLKTQREAGYTPWNRIHLTPAFIGELNPLIALWAGVFKPCFCGWGLHKAPWVVGKLDKNG